MLQFPCLILQTSTIMTIAKIKTHIFNMFKTCKQRFPDNCDCIHVERLTLFKPVIQFPGPHIFFKTKIAYIYPPLCLSYIIMFGDHAFFLPSLSHMQASKNFF